MRGSQIDAGAKVPGMFFVKMMEFADCYRLKVVLGCLVPVCLCIADLSGSAASS